MTVFIGVVKALYDYDPQTDEELGIREGDLLYLLQKSDIDEWWTVKKRVVGMDTEEPTGLVPSNYVDAATVVGTVRALYDYEEAQNPEEEITFRENELFDLLDDNDKDWLLVQSRSTGSYGFIPGNYVEPAQSPQTDSTPTLPNNVSEPMAPETVPEPMAPETVPEPIPLAPEIVAPAVDPSLTPVNEFPPPPQRIDREINTNSTVPVKPSPPSNTEPPLPSRPMLADESPLPSPPTKDEPPLPSRPTLSDEPPLPSRPTLSDEPPLPGRPASPDEPPLPSPARKDEPPLPSRPRDRSDEEGEGPPPPKPVRPTTTGSAMTGGPDLLLNAGIEKENNALRPGVKHDYMGLNSSDYHTWIVAEVEGRKKRKCKLIIGGKKIYFEPMDGYPEEWTIDKLTSYDHEKKHIFLDFVEPHKSLELHAGSSSTCDEIISVLGEYKGAQRDAGFREIEEASKPKRQANVIYDFRAESRDELTIRQGQVVYIVNDKRSRDWWLCELVSNGKRGMVPADCLEVVKEKNKNGGGFFDSLKRFTGTSEKYNAKQNAAKEAGRKERDREREKLRNDSRGNGTGGRPARSRGNWKDDEAQSLNSARTRSNSMAQRRSFGGPSKVSFPDPKKSRIWADRSGTFKVEAQFIGCTEGKIHLHKANGVKIAVAAEKLSDEDLLYVERVTGFSLDKFKSKNFTRDQESEEQDRNLRRKELEELRMAREMLNDERAKIKEFTEEKPLKPPRPQKTGESNAPPNVVTLNYQPQYDWFEFFLNCGVDVSNCQRYTINFEKEKLAEDMMKDINESMLRTLGLREGDIVRVMKYLDKKFDREPKFPQSQTIGGMFSQPDGSLKVPSNNVPPAPPLTQNLLPQISSPNRQPQGKDSAAQNHMKPSLPDIQNTVKGTDDDTWTSKPAANSESTVSVKNNSSDFTGSMQDLIDLRPLEPKKKEPSAPEPNIKDLKPVNNGTTPLSSAETGDATLQLNPFKTGGNNILPVVMMPVSTGNLMSMQRTGGLVLPPTTFGTAQDAGDLMQPQKTNSGSLPMGLQLTDNVSRHQTSNSGLAPMASQFTGRVPSSNNPTPINFQATGGVNAPGYLPPMNLQTMGGILQPQRINTGIASNGTGGPMQLQGSSNMSPMNIPGGGVIPQTTFGSQSMSQSMGATMPVQTTGVSMPKLGSVLPVQKTGNGIMPVQPTGGNMPMLATGSKMPIQRTGGLIPLQRTGGVPTQPTGNLVPLQRTGGIPMQPTGNLIPVQRTGGMPIQPTGNLVPVQRTGGMAMQPTGSALSYQRTGGDVIPQTSFGANVTGGVNMMPQTSFGGSHVTGGANLMPQTSFGGSHVTGGANLMPQASFGGSHVTGGANLMPQTSFGTSGMTGGAGVIPQTSFDGSQITGGTNLMPHISFGGQQIGTSNLMPQTSNYNVQQIVGGTNMMPQTSFGGPQMTHQFPQTSFGTGMQSGMAPMAPPGQQVTGAFQQNNQFGTGGVMPQQSFGGSSFNGGVDVATQGMQNMSMMQTPLQAQPTGFGFGNGPQQLQQPQQNGARQANLFNATPDNPFGF